MGMVGGGRDAFIGEVHRMAARLDGLIELVCGAFSSSPEKSLASGRDLFLPQDRCYPSWSDMLSAESRRDDAMDFVVIVTPNDLHFPIATAALESGFHVLCDKPMTRTLAEAEELATRVEGSRRLFALTHNYTGYPMVREARHRVRSGELGAIRKVMVEYPQGWLSTRLEKGGQKQADWRTDPERAGPSCCMGDIGTHAENLAEFITGLRLEAVCADLSTFVEGRRLDDDGSVLLRFFGGARGVLQASQVSAGEENALSIRVFGELGGLEWHQQEPNTLVIKWQDRPRQVLRTGGADLCAEARSSSRLPAGHPEGFLEAFANLYRDFAVAVEAHRNGTVPPPTLVPNVQDGLRGMRFLDAVVRSSASDGKWLRLA